MSEHFLPQNKHEARGLALALGRATAWGALTLVDPAKLKGWRHAAYWAGVAGLTGVEIVAAPDDGVMDRQQRAAVGIGLAGLVFGTRDWATRMDAKTTGWMRKIGIKHPRPVLALVAGAGAFAAYMTERISPHDDLEYDVSNLPEEDLPDNLHAIIAKLLGAVDGYDRELLEDQLETTRMIVEDPRWPMTLLVDDELPRARLSEFTWPVTATYQRDGYEYHLYLDIAGGRLAGFRAVRGPSAPLAR